MSTKCLVGIAESADSVKSIYCHFDGYPEHMVPTLLSAYDTEEKVLNLIGLGSCSYIGTIFEDSDINKFSLDSDVTISYIRDCGEPEEYNSAVVIPFESFISEHEFAYLYDHGWKAYHNGKQLLPS